MATGIIINPNTNNCQPEYTKIVAHSFLFSPSNITENPPKELFIGAKSENGITSWSQDDYNLQYTYNSGIITRKMTPDDQAASIPLPINLVPNDIVTLNGTAYFNNALQWLEQGWSVNLVVGVYYFNCSDFKEGNPSLFSFIPVQTFSFDSNGIACFLLEETLFSNFDKHDTRFVLGYNIYAECQGECELPATPRPIITVSHTFDIERPCAAVNTNFIIKNCCEPIITELVNIPGLQVGNFHVDDEGNCWEVISESKDVTNFTRNFVDTYTSCVECQTANECPQNLVIQSCCVQGAEFVTGSLPGLVVGDVFVDNHGLCWSVIAETSAPISEESITVVSSGYEGCEDCKINNPCPSFWFVKSCCNELEEVIATTVPLNQFDSFVDTNGMCWSVQGETNQLPTNYGIVVDIIYTGAVEPDTNCDLCISANNCPTEYFLTIKSCCGSRIEVTQVPAEFMSFREGTIFKDYWGICWEVMSYDTTGVETYPVFEWSTISEPISVFEDCQLCGESEGKATPCNIYEVVSCENGLTYTVISNQLLVDGQFYTALSEGNPALTCFEVIGFGVLNFISVIETVQPLSMIANCSECNPEAARKELSKY